jgi:hypothetical protein
MYQPEKQTIAFSKNLRYVNTCPHSPAHGMAFCHQHVEIVQEMGIPTKLKEFLEYKKEHKLTEINSASLATSAADCQGEEVV